MTWPANEIFLNPIVESEKRNKRWFTAYRSLEEAIHKICDCVKETRDLGGIALIIRLGIVPQSDKSLIIAVSGHTPSEATIAAREILEQLSRVQLQKIAS
ncbi:hypothetical protein BSKO_00841 [Bryopsis sp. KO-2023]|nr:hypothetical protein BSKO_00841 [Bryopsis sp. KO-2023]